MKLDPERHWECPNCTVTAVTKTARAATPFHTCRGAKGLWSPLIPAGMDCKLVINEREDYIGDELVRVDGEGRPIMNVVTERADGSNDIAVYAPIARGGGSVNQ